MLKIKDVWIIKGIHYTTIEWEINKIWIIEIKSRSIIKEYEIIIIKIRVEYKEM
jgi:hypothetical protein